MQAFQDVFISYGRRDSLNFADKLNRRLVDRGFTVWFDYDDIPLGVDYQKQIDDGIERADNFLFVISPHSINSPYCGLELELALKRNKRIIPLLHVERIDRAIWQARNPEGTEAEWADYQAKGLHDHFQNMHPVLRKLNWIYVREGQDDFEKAFVGLLEILDRHKDYVHQHTLLLAKALEWEQQQKRSPYLLIGEERLQAEDWLKVRFTDSQPPCLPTDLHCEFITESRKNADNLMTEVFLAYADKDRPVAEQIRNSLRREGLTVWSNTTDIQAGEDFQQVIDRGIEEADNVVYLLSPASVRSPWCQHELDYALSLHKRIIPVRLEAIVPDLIPLKLRDLQYIDLADNLQESDYQQDESQLLRILRQDAAYHEDHKRLLTKALKWEEQKRNPTLLLRGYNLDRAEAWLKVANQNTAYPPVPLQEAFITESLHQPPGISLDVFISYSRADSGFARKLNHALQVHGKRTWFDQESIAAGTADFQQEIHRGIESADTFLFVLSPRSITSPYCADEVEYAANLNKRFVTLLYQPFDATGLHPELAKVQWLDFNQNGGDFSANLTELLRILDRDGEHIHAHTRLLLRAIEWEEKGRKESLLLRGDELEQAEQWLNQATGKEPQPTELQQSYLATSRTVEDAQQQATRILQDAVAKGQRRVLIGTVVALAGVMMAGIAGALAFHTKVEADRAKENAQLEQQGNDVLKRSSDSFRQIDTLLEAMKLGQDVQRILKTTPGLNSIDSLNSYPAKSPVIALQFAVNRVMEQNQVSGSFPSFSQDGQFIVTSSSDNNTSYVYERSGKQLAQLQGSFPSFSQDGQFIVTSLRDGNTSYVYERSGKQLAKLQGSFPSFSQDGQFITTYPKDGDISYVYERSGKQLAKLQGSNPSFSQDGQFITTYPKDGDISYVYKRSGKQLAKLQGSNPSFSQDGQFIATSSRDGNTSYVYERSGKQLAKLQGGNPSFSQDGQFIATYPKDGDISYVYERSGKQLAKLQGSNPSFSQDGQFITTYPKDGDISYVYERSGKQLAKLQGSNPSFSQDGQFIVTNSFDNNTSYVYERSGKQLAKLQGDFPKFSQDGQFIATNSYDNNTSYVYERSGKQLAKLQGDFPKFSQDGQFLLMSFDQSTSSIYGISSTRLGQLQGSLPSFSQDGQFIATSSSDNNTSYVYERSGKQLAKLQGGNPSFSEDGQFIATFSRDNTSYVYERSGKQLAKLQGSYPRFSQDGQFIVTSSSDNNTSYVYERSGKQLAKLQGGYPSFSEDRQFIVTSSSDNNTSYVYERSGKQLAKLQGSYPRFSQDGQFIATNSYDNNTSYVYERSGKQLAKLQGGYPSFSEDGQFIATNSYDNNISYLYERSGKQLAKLQGSLPRFSEDGQFIATSSSDNTSYVYRHSGQQLFKSKEKESFKIFSQDGQFFVTADSTTTYLYNFSGKRVAELQGEFADLSKDGKRIVTTSIGKANSYIYDLISNRNFVGKLIAEFPGSSGVLAPDGQDVITYTSEKVGQVWHIDYNLDRLLAEGCSSLHDYLTTHPENLERLPVCQESTTKPRS